MFRSTKVQTSLLFVALILAQGSAMAAGRAPDETFESAFERLKTLAGTWEAEDDEREVRYYLTGDGSALVELFAGMSSVYHMDGADLRVTHYCGARNQPRMRAVSYDPEKGVLEFDFVDVTNLSAPTAYYTSEIRISFIDEDRVEIHFNGLDEGEERPATVKLRRK